jgi:hypothetical protein
LFQAFGSVGCKVTTPLVRTHIEDRDLTPLSEEDAFSYRSHAMRLGFISQDRTDLQRSVRELAKGLQNPTVYDHSLLKRVVRYLRHKPRLIQQFRYQWGFRHLDVYSDSDHAGCVRTRKSTTGGAVMMGTSMIKSWCRGQSVIALSSGEAEFYALLAASCEALGEQAMARGFGIHLPVRVHMDATAGAAIGSRKGLAKVKHIHTAFLWIQDKVAAKIIELVHVNTKLNLADILTKPIDSATLELMLKLMGFVAKEGNSDLALKA